MAKATSLTARCAALARLVVATVIAGTVTVGLIVGAGVDPARADPVADAQARVAALQADVAVVADRLAVGTRILVADQGRQRQVARQLRSNTRRVTAARAEAAASTQIVGQIAAQLYRSPTPGLLLLSLSASEMDINDVLAVQANLAQVGDRQNGQVRRAVADRVRLQGDQVVIRELAAEADDLARRSAARRGQLIALARSTGSRLDSAQTALAEARRVRAAQQAAERSARAIPTGLASCSGGSTAGQANGNLDPAVLCPVWGARAERLRADAARAFNAMSQAKARSTGSPLCVTDAYRPYREQVIVYAQTPAMTAIPGTSNHGWGQAVDLCGGAERYNGAAYLWLKANAGRFGWHHPAWAEPGQRQEEPWHWEFGT